MLIMQMNHYQIKCKNGVCHVSYSNNELLDTFFNKYDKKVFDSAIVSQYSVKIIKATFQKNLRMNTYKEISQIKYLKKYFGLTHKYDINSKILCECREKYENELFCKECKTCYDTCCECHVMFYCFDKPVKISMSLIHTLKIKDKKIFKIPFSSNNVIRYLTFLSINFYNFDDTIDFKYFEQFLKILLNEHMRMWNRIANDYKFILCRDNKIIVHKHNEDIQFTNTNFLANVESYDMI